MKRKVLRLLIVCAKNFSFPYYFPGCKNNKSVLWRHVATTSLKYIGTFTRTCEYTQTECHTSVTHLVIKCPCGKYQGVLLVKFREQALVMFRHSLS